MLSVKLMFDIVLLVFKIVCVLKYIKVVIYFFVVNECLNEINQVLVIK